MTKSAIVSSILLFLTFEVILKVFPVDKICVSFVVKGVCSVLIEVVRKYINHIIHIDIARFFGFLIYSL